MMNPSDSNEITRKYFDSILMTTRYIDSDLPDLSVEIFGKTFNTPVGTAALSHLHNCHEDGMVELARGAKLANAINFCGMESYDGELDDIMTAGADTVRIIKPHADNKDVFSRIEHAKKLGVFAMGMDIDHSYSYKGGYDVVEGFRMKPKSFDEMAEFVKASEGIPFVVKGVMSVEDAKKCVEIGAKGIVVSHHHGIMPYSVPPMYMLPKIKEAVGKDLTIFTDCGFESGADVYKAIASGADAVCIGRALMPPLKENGAQGVADKINNISTELATLMARTGFKSVMEVDDRCLVRTWF